MVPALVLTPCVNRDKPFHLAWPQNPYTAISESLFVYINYVCTGAVCVHVCVHVYLYTYGGQRTTLAVLCNKVTLLKTHLFVCVCVCVGVCVRAHVCVHRHTYHGECVEVRGQPAGIDSSLPPCGVRGTNLGHQAWWQAPLPAESLCCPHRLSHQDLGHPDLARLAGH